MKKTMKGLCTLAAALLFTTTSFAGDLEPSAPPAPTMVTLNDLMVSLDNLSSQVSGYRYIVSAFGEANANEEHNILTVPTDKTFILTDFTLKNNATIMLYETATDGTLTLKFELSAVAERPQYHFISGIPFNGDVTWKSYSSTKITINGYLVDRY